MGSESGRHAAGNGPPLHEATGAKPGRDRSTERFLVALLAFALALIGAAVWLGVSGCTPADMPKIETTRPPEFVARRHLGFAPEDAGWDFQFSCDWTFARVRLPNGEGCVEVQQLDGGFTRIDRGGWCR